MRALTILCTIGTVTVFSLVSNIEGFFIMMVTTFL